MTILEAIVIAVHIVVTLLNTSDHYTQRMTEQCPPQLLQHQLSHEEDGSSSLHTHQQDEETFYSSQNT